MLDFLMNNARIYASFEHFRKTYEFESLKVKFCLFFDSAKSRKRRRQSEKRRKQSRTYKIRLHLCWCSLGVASVTLFTSIALHSRSATALARGLNKKAELQLDIAVVYLNFNKITFKKCFEIIARCIFGVSDSNTKKKESIST